MVKNIILLIAILFYAQADILTAQVNQSPASIQQQEALADSQKSASINPTYATPFQVFQAFYASVQANSSKATFACLTPNCISNMFGASAPSSDADYANLDTKMNQQERNYTLISFIFTANNKSPEIAVGYKCTRTINGQDSLSVEHVTLTLIDTNTGWKIDDWEN